VKWSKENYACVYIYIYIKSFELFYSSWGCVISVCIVGANGVFWVKLDDSNLLSFSINIDDMLIYVVGADDPVQSGFWWFLRRI
jgi:hypothetical protein